MKKLTLILFLFLGSNAIAQNLKNRYALVIHGGAGTILKEKLTPELESQYNVALQDALTIGQNILANGGLAIEAVEKVVKFLEDCPLFNAGKGSVFNHEGKQEMDACIMDGKNLACGSVSGVSHLKNPIEGARLVKDSSEHVFLYGQKADEFCLSKGATYADSLYFFTDFRWKQFMKAKKKEQIHLDHDTSDLNYNLKGIENIDKFGTVGAVALDRHGNLAAATSTGGLTNKKYGRIGDSPIVGAGTYADNLTCAVSCTGKGEDFIRATIARSISAEMEFGHKSLKKAAKSTLEKLSKINGSGGFIALDNQGNYVMLFNTKGMYRGFVSNEVKPFVRIYESINNKK